MKKGKVFVLGMLAAALTFGLLLAGCDIGGGESGIFPLSGLFGGVQFYLQGGGTASTIKAVTDNSYPLSGALYDESNEVLVRLQGIYDADTGNWSVSARSEDSDVVYTIDGNVDGAGNFRAGATVVEPSGNDEWAPDFFPVIDAGSPFTPNGTIAESKTGGMPSVAHGYWIANWEATVPGGTEKVFSSLRCLISDWKIKVTGTETYSYAPGSSTPLDQNQTIIEVNEVNGSYEVISCYPEYVPTAANFAAALTDYLGNGEIAYYTDPNQQPPEGRWVYMGPYDLAPVCGGDFTEADTEKMVEFYAVNGWEAWAATHSVTPVKKYAKYKFVFNGNSFEMTKMIRGGGTGGALAPAPHLNTYTFDTLQDLTTGTELIEEHKFAYPGGAGAPSVDCGILTTTFTHN
ncbi:MAG: hypothetical protein LBK83_16540 [Treponema sp.]|jgi:hypothetical protein|nr:hypothetical protein [Treponema sp.]